MQKFTGFKVIVFLYLVLGIGAIIMGVSMINQYNAGEGYFYDMGILGHGVSLGGVTIPTMALFFIAIGGLSTILNMISFLLVATNSKKGTVAKSHFVPAIIAGIILLEFAALGLILIIVAAVSMKKAGAQSPAPSPSPSPTPSRRPSSGGSRRTPSLDDTNWDEDTPIPAYRPEDEEQTPAGRPSGGGSRRTPSLDDTNWDEDTPIPAYHPEDEEQTPAGRPSGGGSRRTPSLDDTNWDEDTPIPAYHADDE